MLRLEREFSEGPTGLPHDGHMQVLVGINACNWLGQTRRPESWLITAAFLAVKVRRGLALVK